MPKIKNTTIHISNGTVNQKFDVAVEYQTDFGFFIRIPAGLNEAFDLLSEADQTKYKAFKLYKGKRNRGDHSRVVRDSAELTVITATRLLLDHLSTAAVLTREVIVVSYTSHNDNYSFNRDELFKDLIRSDVGVQLSMAYCIEVNIPGGKPKYEMRVAYQPMGRDEAGTHTRNVEVNNKIVIDNTPENKEFLENMYQALDHLNQKMDAFFNTSDQLLQLISSKQKLLS